MMTVAMLCALYVWEASTDPVDHYEAFLDGVPYATMLPIIDPNVEICVTDGEPHVVTVVAFDAEGNASEVSDPSLPRVIQADIPRVPFTDTCRADFDGSGVVGMGDFGEFLAVFNTWCER